MISHNTIRCIIPVIDNLLETLKFKVFLTLIMGSNFNHYCELLCVKFTVFQLQIRDPNRVCRV